MTIELSDELAITRCMLYGCTFDYNDYGHPQRASAKKYWRCASAYPTNVMVGLVFIVGHGHTQAEAARRWLWLRFRE